MANQITPEQLAELNRLADLYLEGSISAEEFADRSIIILHLLGEEPVDRYAGPMGIFTDYEG